MPVRHGVAQAHGLCPPAGSVARHDDGPKFGWPQHAALLHCSHCPTVCRYHQGWSAKAAHLAAPFVPASRQYARLSALGPRPAIRLGAAAAPAAPLRFCSGSAGSGRQGGVRTVGGSGGAAANAGAVAVARVVINHGGRHPTGAGNRQVGGVAAAHSGGWASAKMYSASVLLLSRCCHSAM